MKIMTIAAQAMMIIAVATFALVMGTLPAIAVDHYCSISFDWFMFVGTITGGFATLWAITAVETIIDWGRQIRMLN